MVDIGRISGPGSPVDPPGGKNKPPQGEEFEKYFKVGEADPEQKKKKQEQEAAKKKKKAEQILQAGSISKESVTDAIRFPKKPKIEKVKEAEKRQAQAEKRREEEVTEIRQAVKTENVIAKTIRAEEKKSEEKSDAIKKKAVENSPIEEPIPPPSPSIQQQQIEEEKMLLKEKDIKKKEMVPFMLPEQQAVPILPLIAPSSEVAGYLMLRSEILELFERMVSVISVMNERGDTETTIHLSAEMAGSLFAGARIVIKEFTTAPKVFNIEFLGTPQNAALFEQNIAGLVAAFRNGNYNFQVHNIVAKLLPSERPVFHRKKGAGDKEEEKEPGDQQ